MVKKDSWTKVDHLTGASNAKRQVHRVTKAPLILVSLVTTQQQPAQIISNNNTNNNRSQ
jgi:hypothetical protein